jgi:hypothetical protein
LNDPVDVGQYVAPVVASVAGLWSGIDRVIFDDLAVLPGETLRAVRTFYGQLDAADVEDQLRRKLFNSTGGLPLPRGGSVPVVYARDDALAAENMAQALWTKHRDILRVSRVEVTKQAPQAISVWSALKVFFSFLGAALRNAPSAWLSGLLDSVSSVLATTVQHAVFGRSDSAFAVVARGNLASWQDIARGAHEMSTQLEAMPGPRQSAEANLVPFWVDYINGALTLADGGRRSAGMEPVSVGGAIGVLRRSADVVPSSADAFTAIPASLAAVIGVSQIAGADVMGVEDVKTQLERTFGDQAAGTEARRAFANLTSWAAATGRSYAAQVSSVLADFLGRARAEVGDLVDRIRATTDVGAIGDELRRRQQVLATITRTAGAMVFVAVLVLQVIAAIGWFEWWYSLVVGALVVAVYCITALGLFVLGQRHLFAVLNLRQAQLSELDALHLNLRAALQDVSRLSAAYGQLLAWNRALGEVLRAPFGPVEPARPPRPRIQDGLPRSMRIGVAAPASADVESTVQSLQHGLYTTGWLTGPWEQMLEAAARRFRDEPAALFRMPGVGTGSAFDEWSQEVASGEVHAQGGDSLWARVQAMLDDPDNEIAESLTSGVFGPADGQRITPARVSGRDRARHNVPAVVPAVPFDASLFTHIAVAAGRSAVALDDTAVDRRGLSYRAVVVQAGEGLPAYDFAMFAPDLQDVGSEDDAPPESGVLVF